MVGPLVFDDNLNIFLCNCPDDYHFSDISHLLDDASLVSHRNTRCRRPRVLPMVLLSCSPSLATLSPQPASGLAWIVTLSIFTGSLGLFFRSTSTASNLLNVTSPSSPMTLPNTVFSPSRCGALSKVKKNCDPLVPGPLFAIERNPRPLCRSAGRISSSNVPPQMECPPLGFSGVGVAGPPV